MTEIIKPLLVRGPRRTKRQTEAVRGQRAVDAFHRKQRALPLYRRLRNELKRAKRDEAIRAKFAAKLSSGPTLKLDRRAVGLAEAEALAAAHPVSRLILDDHET